jgi:hypothetical protein
VSDLLRNFLADRDIPCPGCGCNLRGLTTSRCGQCHRWLRLDVQAKMRVTHAWLGALVCLGVGSGPWLIACGTAMLNWLFDSGYRPPFYWPALIGFLGGSCPISIWIALRERVERRDPRTRAALCTLAGLAGLLGSAAFFYLLVHA